ncbi:MAG TPA: DUF1616 domain-containing protein [Ktedonobacteraceae bacterium]|nr:DUF1616 domain-containing protein [Ktedonobacteraceae bacterium]
MRQKDIDLIVAIVLSMLNVLWALLPDHLPVIGVILAIPLVFLLPGYALTQVLSYQRSFDALHHLMLSIGLSLAIDIVSGFVLNMLPGGLQATSWAILLGLFTTGCSVLGVYLRQKIHMQQASSWHIPFTFPNAMVLALAIVVTILSILYSVLGVMQQPHKLFTQLWLLPASQTRQSCAVQVGVQNFEATSTTYGVEMRINGVLMHTWLPVSLETQHSWEQQVSLTPGTADGMQITVQLYRVENTRVVYRKVNLTMHVLKGSQNGQNLGCTV